MKRNRPKVHQVQADENELWAKFTFPFSNGKSYSIDVRMRKDGEDAIEWNLFNGDPVPFPYSFEGGWEPITDLEPDEEDE